MRRTRLKLRAILDSLSLTPAERRSTFRSACRRVCSTNGRTIAYWILMGFQQLGMGLVVWSVVYLLTRPVVPLLPAGIPLLMQLAVAVVAVYLFARYALPEGSHHIRLAVLRELGRRGYRFCHACGYDVRELPDAIEACPECSAYLTQYNPAEADEAGLPGILKTDTDEHIRKYVSGVPTDPIVFERVLIAAGTKRAKRYRWFMGILFGLILVSNSITSATLTAIAPNQSGTMRFLIRMAAVAPIVFGAFGFAYFSHVLFKRDVRKAFWTERVPVCLACGVYWGDGADSLNVCPACSARGERAGL